MSMSDVLVVVLCYDGDKAQVVNQLEAYTHHEAPVLLLSPEDAKVTLDHPQVSYRWAGLSGWKGRHVGYKLLEHWKIALEYPQNWFLIHEPDSVCLSPTLPDYLFTHDDVLWSTVLGDPGAEGSNYQAPWFSHRKVLERMVEVSEEYIEEWSDAWEANDGEGMGNSEMVSMVVRDGQLLTGKYPDCVWTYQEHDRNLLLSAAGEGCRFVTGIKTPEVFRAVWVAYTGGVRA